MKRKGSVLALIFFFGLFGSAPILFAQGYTDQPGPAPSAEVLGLPLVAWSQMQKPKPVPQPLPPPDRPDQQPETPDAQQPSQPAAPSTAQDEQPAAQTFTGTIVKTSGKYVLKVAKDSVYQLDDQEKAKQYEGKQVRIAGHLDENRHMLHVVSMELLS